MEKIYNNNIIAVTTKIKDEEVANIMNKYDLIVLNHVVICQLQRRKRKNH